MQDLLTVTLVLAGLFFSICCALLLEELVFGIFFRAMSAGRRGRRREGACATQVTHAPEKQEWAIPISQQRHEGGGVSCSH